MAFRAIDCNARLVMHDEDKIIILRDFAKLTDPITFNYQRYDQQTQLLPQLLRRLSWKISMTVPLSPMMRDSGVG